MTTTLIDALSKIANIPPQISQEPGFPASPRLRTVNRQLTPYKLSHERGDLQAFSHLPLHDSCIIYPVERQRCNSDAGPKDAAARVQCDQEITTLMSRRLGRERPDLTMLGNYMYAILGRRRGLPVGGSARVFCLSADVLSQSSCSSHFHPSATGPLILSSKDLLHVV